MKLATLKTISSFLVLSIFTVGCDQMKQLKEMHDNTAEMNASTKEMNASTKELLVNMAEMKNNMNQMGSTMTDMSSIMKGMDGKMRVLVDKMDEVYDSARPALAKILRDNAWAQLQESESVQGKIAAAGVYNMAFEFQMWSGHGADNAQKRIDLATDAVKEFYRKAHEYLPENLKDVETVSSNKKRCL